MSNPPTPIRAVSIGASLCVIAGLVGCASGPVAQRDAQVRGNTTPELETLSQRPIDRANTQAVVWDENTRMANDDWDRLWLMDRTSRLTRWRMPH